MFIFNLNKFWRKNEGIITYINRNHLHPWFLTLTCTWNIVYFFFSKIRNPINTFSCFWNKLRNRFKSCCDELLPWYRITEHRNNGFIFALTIYKINKSINQSINHDSKDCIICWHYTYTFKMKKKKTIDGTKHK